jgi:molybdopterin/thiamine biosynthesis adenylyltransferase
LALANFFEKNALAAHQILGGLDAEALAELLDGEVVGLAIDRAGAETIEGRYTASLAVDLVARFYPRIRLAPLGRGMARHPFIRELTGRAETINPAIEFSSSPFTRVLVIGSSRPPDAAETVVYLGSDGWKVRLSPSYPVGSGDTSNPFGAGGAACVGVANIFRAVMRRYLPGARLDREVNVSVLDWGTPIGGTTPPDLDAVALDVSETLLGGVGAIGNAVIWALARVPRLRGTLRLIDPELIELSNLQRYVLTTQESTNRSKVELAASELRRHHPDLAVTEHPQRWGVYLHGRGNWTIPRVATAFDSPADRIAAQGALPRSLLNAWTQLGDLGVSRHTAFGEAPCVACLYTPLVGGKSDAERIANDLGFPGAPLEIRNLLYTDEPVSELFVRRVAANLGKTSADEIDILLRYAGRPLRQFHTETVCGGVMLELGVRPGERPVEAPMAFQSALAGITLAAEIVLDAVRRDAGHKYHGPTRTVLDLLRPVPTYPHPPISRRERCICSDQDYVGAYREKYEPHPTIVQR